MPTSIDPQPAKNEFECANCGAYFHYELTRCPNCGINLYEPDDDAPQKYAPTQKSIFEKFSEWLRYLFKKPYPVDNLFGAAINQADLYNDLLLKVGGDRPVAERLIEFEKQKLPGSNRMVWIKNAIQRWERDNQRHHI
jgi:hypothetical protein